VPKKKPAKRAKASGTGAVTLSDAICDLKSDAYRELLAAAGAKEIDELLAGVAWRPGKHVTIPGELRGNALFMGRGTTARPMAARLLAFLAAAPGDVAAEVRSAVQSLGIDAKAGVEISG
jgi:hypothetical protein